MRKELSKVYDPRVVRLAAVYAIILSFSPKFDALVNSIPTAIIGGVIVRIGDKRIDGSVTGKLSALADELMAYK